MGVAPTTETTPMKKETPMRPHCARDITSAGVTVSVKWTRPEQDPSDAIQKQIEDCKAPNHSPDIERWIAKTGEVFTPDEFESKFSSLEEAHEWFPFVIELEWCHTGKLSRVGGPNASSNVSGNSQGDSLE